jgi:nucleoside-diphosphate-sugar epimerase
VLRFASLYGRAPRPRFDLVVNLLTAKAVRDGLVTIHGGEQSRPFLHVEDCARAVLALLAAPAAGVSGEVLNVGDPGGNYRLREVGALILELVPDASLTVDERVVDRRTYAVDVTKLAATVPFVPRQSLRREGGGVAVGRVGVVERSAP